MNPTYRRTTSIYYNTNYKYNIIQTKENGIFKMHGSRRVVVFCLLTTVLPTVFIVLPLYLRHVRYADVMYKISDSDVIQIHKGQSSIFCDKHVLKMNNSFNAFQMKGKPELSNKRKHIRLKKSMILPDDTLEYWGFYLFKGAFVELQACSRYDGSKILVVKGERILNTCGILENNKYKIDPPAIENKGHVLVTLENPEQKLDKLNWKERGELSNMNSFENITKLDISLKTDQGNSIIINKTQYYHNAANANKVDLGDKARIQKRDTKLHRPNTVLDTGVNHGGNAFDSAVSLPQDLSISSFEINLHQCYQNNILINEFFPYSIQCNSTNYLEEATTLKVMHNVSSDGYYYYIFYSDNDIVKNDLHAIFDIYKPTFQYENISETKICVNSTDCEFNVDFLSDELVIVEIPTEDGMKNDDNEYILMSVCHPRMSVYIFFPIIVILLILLFAFL